MAMDRDLAVALVRAWRPGGRGTISGWEMMAATGARGLRVLHETGAFETFTLTEANPRAFEVLTRNAQGFAGARPVRADAHAPGDREPYDYVDLDPYGTPAPLVPRALAAVRPGGVLAVTATDMPVLAGAQPAACRRRYGSQPVRGRLGPEGGLRILLAFLERSATERGRSIRPLLAYVRGHHVRAYVEVRDAPGSAGRVGPIDSASWAGPYLGPDPRYGPLWLGPLFDPEIVGRLEPPPAAAEPRACAAFVAVVREESSADVPFYYEPNTLAGRLGLPFPPSRSDLIDGLRAAGYRATRTHARPEGVRSDAPRRAVEEIARRRATPGQSQKARVRA